MTAMITRGPNADLVTKIATRREDHVRRLAAVRRSEADRQANTDRAAANAWYDLSTQLALDLYRGNELAAKLSFLTRVYEIALDVIDENWARHIAKRVQP